LRSTQHGGNADFFLSRQIGFALVGFIGMIFASRLSPAKARNLSWILYGIALGGLIMTKFSPLGFSMGNTERWVKLGPLTLQFSELAKIALIGVMADFWSRAARDSHRSIWPWLAAGVLVGMPLVLTFIQPHLSATIVLFVVPLAIAYYSGAPSRHFGFIVGALVVFGGLTLTLCKTGSMPLMPKYQQHRIASFLSGGSKESAKTSHYQQDQGERALMRGGVAGVGLGASLSKWAICPRRTPTLFMLSSAKSGDFWARWDCWDFTAQSCFSVFKLVTARTIRSMRFCAAASGRCWACRRRAISAWFRDFCQSRECLSQF
jgi:cell division protein FtsW